MKFHLARADGRNAFSGYGAGYVTIGTQRFEHSVIVLPDRILDWDVENFAQLSQAVFESIAALPVDVLVLGTGEALRFPPPAHLQPLVRVGIGVEVMDTAAACRTYNVLLAEDRRVAAAILIPS